MTHASTRRAVCGYVLAVLLAAGSLAIPAQQPGGSNPSHPFGPDQCGPADPSYIRTANETGGIPLFLQRSEAGKAMQLMRESTRENVSTVLWASSKLNGGMQRFDIPVDSITERITFTFSVDTKGTGLVLRGPDGHAMGEGSVRTEDTELNCGRLITVEKPQAGLWRAEVSGSGTFWLEAQAQSDIYLISSEFVRLGGRPGHEGLFKIQGQPLMGEPATLQASLSATDAKTTEFSFVSERGDVLQKLPMKASNADREFLEFTGDVELPSVPFRVAVSGLDKNGKQYQRFEGRLFHAESVAVVPKLSFDELSPGAIREAAFDIRNLGPARSFKVTVTDAHRFVTAVEPPELAIGAHQTVSLKVTMKVPLGTAGGTGDDLVVLVSSTSGMATTNAAVIRLTVAANAQGQPPH
jgi:von Willebrand factor A domain-containing protein 7